MPRVLAPHRGPLGAEVLLVAAGLWAGPTAVLTGGLALRRLGLQVARVDRTTVLVPLSARARTHGRVRTVRTGRPPAVGATLGVVRVAGAARALADAAVHESHAPADLQHLAISVLHRGLATPDALERELWGRSQARVGPVWRGLEAYVGCAWSRPEGVLREVVDCDGSLPPMVTNCGLVRSSDGLYLGTPDGYIEAAGVAVQVHSRTYHQGIDDQGGDRWGRTVEKDTPLVAAGVRVVGVTPWTLYSRPARFLRQLHQVVELGLAGPRPAVRVVAPRTR